METQSVCVCLLHARVPIFCRTQAFLEIKTATLWWYNSNLFSSQSTKSFSLADWIMESGSLFYNSGFLFTTGLLFFLNLASERVYYLCIYAPPARSSSSAPSTWHILYYYAVSFVSSFCIQPTLGLVIRNKFKFLRKMPNAEALCSPACFLFISGKI
jgi:hypothetical protein